MARKENDKQINFTLCEKRKEDLDEYCKETGLSQNAAMNKATDLLLMHDLKTRVPDMISNIDDFELHVNRLLSLYKESIEHSLLADERAKKDVKEQLDGMGKLLDDLRETREKNNNLEKENTRLRKENEMFQTSISLEKFETLKLENIKLREELSNIREKHSKEIEEIRNEQWKKFLELINSKL